MFSLLIAIIYLAFISLGLPDTLLGSAWPVMYSDLGVPLSYAGIITFIIAAGTVISSLLSDRLTLRFGAGRITAFSVLLTALAILGFSLSRNFWLLCLVALPYGLGAGAVDAALNNYVALHYSSRHMNWLHCFWGVGVTISPYIMSWCLGRRLGWQMGYRAVAAIQLAIAGIIFASLPMWKKRPRSVEVDGEMREEKPVGLRNALRIRGVKEVLAAFLCYCALESTAILWSTSYLHFVRGVDEVRAAKYGAWFCMGIMIGRFASGFVSNRIGDRRMIRIGSAVVATGLAMVFAPGRSESLAIYGLLIMGLGCAPIYPSIIHSTPSNFGERNSQAIIGIQMASAYVGSTIMPPLFGVIADRVSMALFPAFMAVFMVGLVWLIERANRLVRRQLILPI